MKSGGGSKEAISSGEEAGFIYYLRFNTNLVARWRYENTSPYPGIHRHSASTPLPFSSRLPSLIIPGDELTGVKRGLVAFYFRLEETWSHAVEGEW